MFGAHPKKGGLWLIGTFAVTIIQPQKPSRKSLYNAMMPPQKPPSGALLGYNVAERGPTWEDEQRTAAVTEHDSVLQSPNNDVSIIVSWHCPSDMCVAGALYYFQIQTYRLRIDRLHLCGESGIATVASLQTCDETEESKHYDLLIAIAASATCWGWAFMCILNVKVAMFEHWKM